MTKAELRNQAVKLFGIHPNIDKLYMTADGQAFTEENYAKDHSRLQKDDKKVYEFSRTEEPVVDEPPVSPDREALIAEYEQLFGTKPAHNAKTDTIVAKIAEKKAELAKATDPDAQ